MIVPASDRRLTYDEPTRRRDSVPDDERLEDEEQTEARAEKEIADVIEAAIDRPASIEEEQMLEAAELLEVELNDVPSLEPDPAESEATETD